MSDRKYRQRGYQDSGPRERPAPQKRVPEVRDPRMPRDPRVPNMPGFRDVFRCTKCGSLEPLAIGPDTGCAKCGADLHCCSQCAFFDAGARFECMQPITARFSPKDLKNTCASYSPRVKVERETGSSAPVNSAKKAFDDLFKI